MKAALYANPSGFLEAKNGVGGGGSSDVKGFSAVGSGRCCAVSIAGIGADIPIAG